MVLAALLEVALLVARADQDRLAIRRGQEAIDELLTALLAPPAASVKPVSDER
jgi:hypothetical protein